MSAQILHEFYVNVTRKVTPPLTPEAAGTQILRLSHLSHVDNLVEDLPSAIEIMKRRRIGFWDALVVHAAVKLSCRVLYTEDMKAGEDFGGTRIVNPFSRARAR